MYSEHKLLLLLVFLPFFGSLILPLVGLKSKTVRNVLCLLFVGASFLCALALAPAVLAGGTLTVRFPTPIGTDWFYADKLAIFMAMVSSLVGSIIVFYSFGYIKDYEEQNEYYFMVCLFLGSMMGLVFSRNLLLLYLFWEVTAIASWRLIGFFRASDIVYKANKAFLVTVFGSLLMLIGFIMIFHQTGTFDLSAAQALLRGESLPPLAVALILIGILAKSATLPLHTWLPDAGVAPSPVTALLHAAVLVKIGVYVYARLFVATFNIGPEWTVIVPWIAAVSALVSAGAALVDTNMKRIIAYSTISQIGFIFLGLSIGNPIGVAGGLLYILMHGISKAGLFLCAGIVEHGTGTKDITKMGGLAKVMPITAASFILCAFSVMGIPPFGGFFSKYMVINGAMTSGQLAIALTFIFGAFLTIMYLFRIFTMMFLGDMKTEAHHEGTKSMVYSVALLAILSLLSGLLISYPADFVWTTVADMFGMAR